MPSPRSRRTVLRRGLVPGAAAAIVAAAVLAAATPADAGSAVSRLRPQPARLPPRRLRRASRGRPTVGGGYGWTRSTAAGSRVAAKRWIYDVGPGANFGTGEIETATDSTANVFQDGRGTLTSGRSAPTRHGRPADPHEALFGAPAGGVMRVSASIRQPDPASGLGYPGRRSGCLNGRLPGTGEIDILEDVNAGSEVASTFHCGVYPERPVQRADRVISSGLLSCAGCQTRFHTYSVIVDRRNATREQIRWYLDGRQIFAVDQNQVPAATWTAAVDRLHGDL